MAKRELYSFANPYRLAVVADVGEFSMTRQEFSAECDINQIMARYEKAGGQWPLPAPGAEPYYYDFVGMPDLRTAMERMIEAESAFMSLPAAVRKEFDNDPLRFVEFAENGDNLGKLREWGLAAPEKPAQEPVAVRMVPEPPAPEPPPAPKPEPKKG